MQELPFPGAIDKTDLSIPEKIALFGPKVIPLFLPWGSKGDIVPGSNFNLARGYLKLTTQDTLLPAYQATLLAPERKNIAIRQGGELTPIVGWDFDIWNFDIAEVFLNANPWARANALVTVGRKGFTLWMRILGLYPPHKIPNVWERGDPNNKEAHEAIEWRANGYSVIHGAHPSGEIYRIYVVGTGIQEVPWSALYCPDATFTRWPKLFSEAKTLAHGPIDKDLLEARLKIIGELFKVHDVADQGRKVNVECPNWQAHSTDTGDGQTIVFSGIDGSAPNFFCSHTHCKAQVVPAQTKRLREAFLENETIQILPDHRDQQQRIYLCRKFEGSGNFYRRGDTYPYSIVYWQVGMNEPIPIGIDNFQDACDRAGIKFSKPLKKEKVYASPPDRQIRRYLAQPELDSLPIVKSYSRRPLLTLVEGHARILTQTFARELGVIVLGTSEQEHALEMDFGEATRLLYQYLSHWKFKTPADASRAIAQLLTPALLQGGFIKKPVPIFLISSNQPAAGKTIWHQFAILIYQEKAVVKAHGAGTVGGTEDMIKQAIKYGDTFCFIDEIKQVVNSPLLNALVTGTEEADVRSAFEKTIRASIDHLIIQFAGVRKDFSMEDQLATRIMPIQILKAPYERAPDGSLLTEWVEKNSLKLLAAIYAIIIEWVEKGAPEVASNSRFPSWSSTINGILEKILGCEHCTSGLTKLQTDMANANVNWLENVIEILREENLFWEGKTEEATSVNAAQIREFLLVNGRGIPGNYSVNSNDAPRVQRSIVARAIRSLVKHKETPKVTIYGLGESFVHCYQCGKDEKGNTKCTYLFSNTDLLPKRVSQYESDGAGFEM